MPEFIESTRFEEQLRDALTTPSDTIVPAGEMARIELAAPVEPPPSIEPTTSVVMDCQMITTREWALQFKEASPSQRAVMFSQIMDLFNDGQEGIFVSFSEPVIK